MVWISEGFEGEEGVDGRLICPNGCVLLFVSGRGLLDAAVIGRWLYIQILSLSLSSYNALHTSINLNTFSRILGSKAYFRVETNFQLRIPLQLSLSLSSISSNITTAENN